METLQSHLLRPKIYYRIGFGWSTDRWFDQKTKRNKITHIKK